MKKFFLMLVLCSSFIFCTNGVYADSLKKGDKVTKIKSYDIKTEGLTYRKDKNGDVNETLLMHRYDFTSPNFNGSTIGYCMDSNVSGATNLVVKRILGDYNDSDFVAAYDYGILEILKLGFSKYNEGLSFSFEIDGKSITVSSNELIQATSIAVRTYTLGLYKLGNLQGSKFKYLTSTYINEGIHWASMYGNVSSNVLGQCQNKVNDYKEARDCYQGIAAGKYGNWYIPKILFDHSKEENTESYRVIYAAQQLFRKGLDAANNFKENGTSEGKIKVSEINSQKNLDTDKDKVSEDKFINFNIKDLSKDGSVTNVNVTCDDCANKGISISSPMVLTNGTWIGLDSVLDISKLVDGNGNVQIKFTATKTRLEECTPATYKINYKVFDPNSEYIGAILHDSKMQSQTQRYLMLLKTDKETNKSYVGSIKCSKESCETLITTPVCSDGEDGVATITAPDKITKCILNNNDDANNTYQLSINNGGVSNDYCDVFCKEDYASITLNRGISDVKCGGYFKLKASIKGSKDCYTSSNKKDHSIDKERYLMDVIRAQEDMIRFYDDLLNYEKALSDVTSRTYTCGDCCSSVTEYYTEGTYTGFEIDLRRTNYKTGEIVGKPVQNKSHFSDSTGSGGCSLVCTGYDKEGNCTGTKCSNNCSGGQRSTLTSKIENYITTAKENLKYAQNNYNRAINDYNSCTTVWTNEFKFEQKIGYEYDQKSYYDLLENSDDKLLEKDGNGNENKQIQVCLGDITDKYECTSGLYNISINKTKLIEKNYATEYDSVFDGKQYVYCSENGCSNPTVQVSNARYVKKSVEKEQKYITPTVFYQIYPSGKITTDGGYNGSQLQLSSLENKLPISPNTVGGGLFKLTISNLGEFYNNNQTGRLIDFGGKNENLSILSKLNNNNVIKYNGEYVCHYYSPCRPDDCPNCEFECVGENCEFEQCDDCVVVCLNCMFDLNELQLNFKTISTNNINSANREFGYNWNIDTKLPSLSLLANKAHETIEEIKDKNDTIYDDIKDTDEDNSLAFSIKMTPNVTNYIKSQNEAINNENIGGYGNDSLTCYDYNDGTNKYDNIFCYSDFIDGLLDTKNGFGDLITVPNRNNDKDTRKTSPNNKYWTPWNGYQFKENVIGGPAWK